MLLSLHSCWQVEWAAAIPAGYIALCRCLAWLYMLSLLIQLQSMHMGKATAGPKLYGAAQNLYAQGFPVLLRFQRLGLTRVLL